MLLAAIVRKLPLQIYALGYNARPASGTCYKYTRLCAYCAPPASVPVGLNYTAAGATTGVILTVARATGSDSRLRFGTLCVLVRNDGDIGQHVLRVEPDEAHPLGVAPQQWDSRNGLPDEHPTRGHHH
jgi:hypothetical protein